MSTPVRDRSGVADYEPAPYRDQMIEKTKVDTYRDFRQKLSDAY